MSVKDVFEKLRTALETAGIPYFVTGSFASSAHGIPRATNDIDIVISPTRDQLNALLAEFSPSDFATNREEVDDAFRRRSSFNIIDQVTFWKVDFLLRQYTPFDASRFSRREIVEIAGVRLHTASAEDILIAKLMWTKLGPSERQVSDCVGIIRVQGANLDREYVEKWVAVLELDDQWAAALAGAG